MSKAKQQPHQQTKKTEILIEKLDIRCSGQPVPSRPDSFSRDKCSLSFLSLTLSLGTDYKLILNTLWDKHSTRRDDETNAI